MDAKFSWVCVGFGGAERGLASGWAGCEWINGRFPGIRPGQLRARPIPGYPTWHPASGMPFWGRAWGARLFFLRDDVPVAGGWLPCTGGGGGRREAPASLWDANLFLLQTRGGMPPTTRPPTPGSSSGIPTGCLLRRSVRQLHWRWLLQPDHWTKDPRSTQSKRHWAGKLASRVWPHAAVMGCCSVAGSLAAGSGSKTGAPRRGCEAAGAESTVHRAATFAAR